LLTNLCQKGNQINMKIKQKKIVENIKAAKVKMIDGIYMRVS
jgi:hypothetical protein